jgi:phospholipid/cholesterol/gamma-HCH transport system substrate-binding protein
VKQYRPGIAFIPLRPGLMQNLEKRGMAILDQAEELSKRLNSLLDPGNRQSLISAVDNISKAAIAWQAVPAKLDPVLNQFPQLVDQAQESFAAFKVFSDDATDTSASIRKLSDELNASDGTFAKFNQSIEQLEQTVTHETLPNINALSREARSTMRSLNSAAETLNERPQSILFGRAPNPPGPGEAGFVAPKQ